LKLIFVINELQVLPFELGRHLRNYIASKIHLAGSKFLKKIKSTIFLEMFARGFLNKEINYFSPDLAIFLGFIWEISKSRNPCQRDKMESGLVFPAHTNSKLRKNSYTK
jgi:hypothetical protein